MIIIVDRPCWVASPDNQHNHNIRTTVVIIKIIILDRPCWAASPYQHYYIIIV